MTTKEAKQQLAQSVETEYLNKLMTQLEAYCAKVKIPYSTGQLYKSMALFDKLCRVVSKPQAMAILDNLMLVAFTRDLNRHWDWVCDELEFEELLYSAVPERSGPYLNHQRMATACLEVLPADEINDEILDMHNERMSRYKAFPEIYSGYPPRHSLS